MNENDELITAGEAAEVLDAVTELPENKCITRGEFDDLVASVIKYTLMVNPTPSDATVKINGAVTKTIEVSPNTTVTVEVSKSGYKTSTQQVQVVQDNQVLSVTLVMLCTLTVNPTPSNATVKINNEVRKSIQVEQNTTVQVEVSAANYHTKQQSVKVTQQSQTLNVVLESIVPEGAYTPNNAPVGIYILSTDGYVYERSSWQTANNSKAVGVAVKTSACSFVIAPDEVQSIQWGGYGTTISGCTTTTNTSTAQIDYNGKANTDAIVAQLGLYTLMLSNMDMTSIVNDAEAAMAQEPETQSSYDKFTPEYISYCEGLKEKSQDELTDEEKQELSEYSEYLIYKQFTEKYEIPTESVNNKVLQMMRTQMKSFVKMQSEIMTLDDPESDIAVTENDIDNITDTGLMLLASTSNEQYAANYCRQYSFKNGAEGYLGALGEWYQAYQNKSEIDACMSLIGGDPLYDSGISNYWKWSSTQYSATDAWVLDWDDGYINTSTKADSLNNDCARPFSAFPA